MSGCTCHKCPRRADGMRGHRVRVGDVGAMCQVPQQVSSAATSDVGAMCQVLETSVRCVKCHHK